MFEIRKPSET